MALAVIHEPGSRANWTCDPVSDYGVHHARPAGRRANLVTATDGSTQPLNRDLRILFPCLCSLAPRIPLGSISRANFAALAKSPLWPGGLTLSWSRLNPRNGQLTFLPNSRTWVFTPSQ